MRQTERGLMLLCLPLGDTLAGALSLAQARELSKRARAIGIGEDDPLREVTQKDVQRLGYSEAEAAHIVALLNRERQLDGYLLAAEKAGVTVVTRLDTRFPQRLREQLGARCPAALFCRGDMSLLQSRCISVVGSRQLHSLGAAFAAQAGRLAAQEGYTLCSGDAMGADRTAQEACLQNGGSALVFPATELVYCPVREHVLYAAEGGFELGVHIADVSNYVKPGSELNEEAFNRATSVYYADQVVPMLPKQLSNGICSLNEGVLRLAFSCLMRLDKDGNLTDYRFVKSVIRSRVKGVYSEINALLAGSTDDELTGKYHEVLAQLPAMKELYGHRARLRKERGCMDIESGEVKLILDEDGHCIDVKKRTSGESEAMIEEFMLLANQCAAHFARVKQIPFVYRVHEEPNAEKLERLHGLLQACGVNDHFAKDVPTPKELSAILEGVRGTAYEQIINVGMLRCMSKAVYEEKPKGHYGLVLQDYAHFTSPIRRYPDLAIHRIMTAQLKGTDKDTMILRYSEFAEDVSKQASEREVIAMQIERKAEDCYKAEYARRHLGECYEGRISGVTQRGLFIELENGVEGFVPASSLTATGTMLTEGVRLSDPVSGKNWNLGDTMMITIVRADVNLGKIDFEVAPESAKQ